MMWMAWYNWQMEVGPTPKWKRWREKQITFGYRYGIYQRSWGISDTKTL